MVKAYTPQEVISLARETLSIDDQSYDPPQVYVRLLGDYLKKNPYDTHFIIELAQASCPDKGGTKRCGVVTCMEEACWLDINLSADPSRPNGGLQDGIGSLWEYQVHCTEPKHVQARNKRCREEGKDMGSEDRLGTAAAPLAILDDPSPPRVVKASSPIPMPNQHTRAKLASKKRANAVASSSRTTLDLISSSSDEIEEVELTPLQKLRISLAQEKKKQKSDLVDVALAKAEPGPSFRPGLGRPKAEMFSAESTPGPVTPQTPPTPLTPYQAEYEAWYGFLEREYAALLQRWAQLRNATTSDLKAPVLIRYRQLRDAKLGNEPYVAPDPPLVHAFPFLQSCAYPTHLDAKLLQIYIKAKVQGKVINPPQKATGLANQVQGDVKSQRGPVAAATVPPSMADLAQDVPGAYPFNDRYRPIDPILGADYSDDEEPGFDRFGTLTRRAPALGATEMKEFFEKSMDDLKDDVTVEDALKKLNLNAIGDKLPGMEISLMAHQVIGVAWMIAQEKKKKFAGGILADAMGLGKTVQTIATMVMNRSEDPKCKTTLVVAPLALLAQWKEEIETKTEEGLFNVLIYHGSGRTKSVKDMQRFDVVLTTYGTLQGEWPKPIDRKSKPTKKKIQNSMNGFIESDSDFGNSSSGGEERSLVRKAGPLFRCHFWRVVLDEAHNIRNKNTQASKAVMELEAEYRWSLTGTLIINSLDDIYAHLHFTAISAQAEWSIFRDHISKLQKRKPKLASKRAQAILGPCMMRRTKDSKIGDQPIFTLPPKIVNVEELEFNDEERAIYQAVEHRAKVRFNKFLKAGTVLKHYHVVLVLLMRLKQLTCHPWLIRRAHGEEGHQDDLMVGDDDDLMIQLGIGSNAKNEMERAVQIIGQEGVDKIKLKLACRAQNLMDVQDDQGEIEECPICYEPFNDEVITPCLHNFCAGCAQDVFNAPLRDAVDLNEQEAGRALQQNMRPCPICRAEIEPGKVFKAAAFEPPVEDDDEDEGMGGNESQAEEVSEDEDGPSKKSKAKRKMGDFADDEDVKPSKLKGKRKARASGLDDILEELEDETEKAPRSTKMKRMVELIEAVAEEDATQKVLVFSQFTSFLDLVSRDLKDQGIFHESYVGSMRQNEREEAIKSFVHGRGPRAPKIMLVSLKCGGVGLNLTCANKVINLDLAWNEATERQAWDRAHRIGQTRPVTISRLVVKDTVEQRILTLQATKQALADGALGEGGSGKLGRLSVKDLMLLFDVRNE